MTEIVTEQSGCDLLILAAHTDDAEIALGGAISLLTGQGRSVWVADLTRGELASNATPDERWAEAEQASRLLGLTGRLQLSLPDGFLASEDAGQIKAVVAVLRSLRPRWLATAPEASRHPDHVALPQLAQKACFLARLNSLAVPTPDWRVWPGGVTVPPPGDPWVPEALLHTCAESARPDLVFDVSGHWTAKLKALRCYPSQFERRAGSRPTAINDAAFLERIEYRGRRWGRLIQASYGEALVTDAVIPLTDLPADRWLS